MVGGCFCFVAVAAMRCANVVVFVSLFAVRLGVQKGLGFGIWQHPATGEE